MIEGAEPPEGPHSRGIFCFRHRGPLILKRGPSARVGATERHHMRWRPESVKRLENWLESVVNRRRRMKRTRFTEERIIALLREHEMVRRWRISVAGMGAAARRFTGGRRSVAISRCRWPSGLRCTDRLFRRHVPEPRFLPGPHSAVLPRASRPANVLPQAPSSEMPRRGKRGSVRPPSMTMARPVTKSKSGEQRCPTIRPISCSVTSRPSGVPAMAAAL